MGRESGGGVTAVTRGSARLGARGGWIARDEERDVAQHQRKPAPAATNAAPIREPRVGWLAGGAERLRVDWPGNERGPVAARTAVPLAVEAIERAVRARTGAVLVFDEGDPARPIVVGLLQSGTPLLDAVLEESGGRDRLEARVDGKRVVIEGRDEVELRCGKASITLRRDGRVEVRGVRLKSEASGLHRIRGGKVEIN